MITLKNETTHPVLLHVRAFLAAILSIIPGLGHIYKAHYREGFEIMLISPFFIWIGILLGWATAGVGLFVPFIFLIAVAWHAYVIEDKRHHLAGIF